MPLRDDFLKTVKDTLAKRVNYICSNPSCRRSTSGPHSEPEKAVTIGVAAHITAAAPGGKRYNPLLTGAQRRSIENGIWLCQSCAWLIDTDEQRYPVSLLNEWKQIAETQVLDLLQGRGAIYFGSSSHVQNAVRAEEALRDQLARLASRVSGNVKERLEEVRSRWLAGDDTDPQSWLANLKGDSDWSLLSDEVRADLLRFEARLALTTAGDVLKAQALATEARILAPDASDNVRLRALIIYHVDGPEKALHELKDVQEVGSLNLKAAFLLELGRDDESRQILTFETADLQPNAESFRLRALLALDSKDINQATLEVTKALELEPHWRSLAYTAAVVDYYSALSYAALPGYITGWPRPTELALVKQDDESVARLRHAAKVFEQLAEQPHISAEDRQTFEAWRLACLLADAAYQQDGVEYARALLERSPTHYQAVIWASVLNLDLDLQPSEKALQGLFDRNEAQLDHILALLSLLLAANKASDARAVVKAAEDKFEERGAASLWRYWNIKTLIATDQADDALAETTGYQGTPELRYARVLALQHVAKQSRDWQPLADYLETSYCETGDPIFLLEICQVKERLHEWEFVADHAERLVSEVRTAEALSLAAFSTFNAGRYGACLELLHAHRTLLPKGSLTAELRRLRVSALQALGVVSEATSEAELLATEEPTATNLFDLARLYVSRGDFDRLLIVAKRLEERADLEPVQALYLADNLKHRDEGLAVQLWRRAALQGIPDPSLGGALNLTFQLGLNEEMRPLLARAADLSEQSSSGFQKVTIEELFPRIQEQRQRDAEVNDLYQRGLVPLHLVAEASNEPLATYFHTALALNEATPDPSRQFALYARHGGRTLPQGLYSEVPSWRLHLDMTALLLAEHLGTLDEVERVFSPLHIPAETIPALVQMRDNLLHPQPSRLQRYQEVIDLVAQGSLRVQQQSPPDDLSNKHLIDALGQDWLALYEAARKSKGFLVDFLPIRKVSHPVEELPEGVEHHLINCRAVVEALPLSLQQCNQALGAIGHEGTAAASTTRPDLGRPLYLAGTTPELLAGADVLGTVCEHFPVYIEQSELERVQAELRYADHRRATTLWLDQLITRLNRGLDRDTYKLIPSPPPQRQRDAVQGSRDLSIHALATLFEAKTEAGDVMWLDDRMLSGYTMLNTAPIIGINEVLKALVSAGVVTEEMYYAKLLQLREANVRFIPLHANEILHHLEQAPIRDGNLVETRELKVLRRYLAACLLQGRLLQRPATPILGPDEAGELTLMLSVGREVDETLRAIWSTQKPPEVCEAYADWVLSSLYIDIAGLRHVTGLDGAGQDDVSLVALGVSSLITKALEFRPEVRTRYFRWLDGRVLRGKFAHNPGLVSAVVEDLKKLVDLPLDAEYDRPDIKARVFWHFFQELPADLKDEIQGDAEFMAGLGSGFRRVVTLGGLNFRPEALWHALAEAVNGREEAVTPTNFGGAVTFHRLDETAVGFTHPLTGEVVGLVDLEVLLESVSERERALLGRRDWFDGPEEERQRTIADIVATEDAEARVLKAHASRDTSVAVSYHQLFQKIRAESRFSPNDLLPPNAPRLLKHFRLPEASSGRTFAETSADAARSLIGDEGLNEVISRFSGLPVPLPAPIIEAVAALPLDQRKHLFKRMACVSYTPVSQLHFIHLLLRFAEDSPSYPRLARRTIRHLLSDQGARVFRAFQSLLQWVSDELLRWPEAEPWAPEIRLAVTWAHTHQLFSIITSSVNDHEGLSRYFSERVGRTSWEVFERDSAHWFDLTHPRRLDRINFLAAGLAYAADDAAPLFGTNSVRAFFDPEGAVVTRAYLLDTSLARNQLGSFLDSEHRDRFVRLLELTNEGEVFGRTLDTMVQEATCLLTSSDDEEVFTAWSIIQLALNDLPPSDITKELLKDAIGRSNLVNLVKRNLVGGLTALQTAAVQIRHLDDPALSDLTRTQILEVTRVLAGMAMSNEPARGSAISDLAWAQTSLLEAALNASVDDKSIRKTHIQAAAMFADLADVWPALKAMLRPAVHRLREELPMSQATYLWPLVLKLRAD